MRKEPKELKAAVKKLENILKDQNVNASVGTGFGLIDKKRRKIDSTAEWMLYVWTENQVTVPDNIDGFNITVRSVPKAY